MMAIGVNRADLLQKKGKYPSPKGWPEWPGLEVAGVVDAMGEIAEQKGRFKIGDRVCALLGGGGYAEYVCAPEGMVMRVPKNLSFEQASTLPEAYATSYLNLFWEGHLKEGNTAFIPAGASGLASVAIPMAKAFKARVITSVLSDEIAEKIKPLGADVVINSSKYDVSEILKQEELNGTPVNMSMDCLSGETLGKSLPYIDKYTVQIVGDLNNETLKFQAGEIDVLNLQGSLVSRYRMLEENSDYKLFNLI